MEATERSYEERRLAQVMQEVHRLIDQNQESIESHRKEVVSTRKWMTENLSYNDALENAELGTALPGTARGHAGRE